MSNNDLDNRKLALESAIRLTGIVAGQMPQPKDFIDLVEAIYKFLSSSQ